MEADMDRELIERLACEAGAHAELLGDAEYSTRSALCFEAKSVRRNGTLGDEYPALYALASLIAEECAKVVDAKREFHAKHGTGFVSVPLEIVAIQIRSKFSKG
jgi:hypothetical protein